MYFPNFLNLFEIKRSVYGVRGYVGPCIFLIPISYWTLTRTLIRKFWTRKSPDPSPEKNDSIGRSGPHHLPFLLLKSLLLWSTYTVNGLLYTSVEFFRLSFWSHNRKKQQFWTFLSGKEWLMAMHEFKKTLRLLMISVFKLVKLTNWHCGMIEDFNNFHTVLRSDLARANTKNPLPQSHCSLPPFQ